MLYAYCSAYLQSQIATSISLQPCEGRIVAPQLLFNLDASVASYGGHNCLGRNGVIAKISARVGERQERKERETKKNTNAD